MRIAMAILLGVTTPALAAEQAQQFDLVCHAKHEVERYRIDLDRGEWCFGNCANVMKIQEVTSGMITLHDKKPSDLDREVSYNTINRVTGEWRWYSYTPRLSSSIMNVIGSCEVADFSGLPARKF